MDITHLAAAGLGYLIGAIPFGLVLTRLAGFGDIRQIGSGNIGATNVLRTGNKFLAFLTLIFDSGKGAVSAWAAIIIWNYDAGLITGFFSVVGHNFPFWLKFRGGKGVATTLGVLFVASWQVGVATCAIWLLIAGTSRYSSLAAMVALATSPIFSEYLANQSVTHLSLGLMLLALFRHRENIRRLIRGEENRIGQNQTVENSNSGGQNL